MKYNPDLHKRRSIRLRGYDYASAGAYFLTICCQNRKHLFGKIVDNKMILNECGEIATQCWREIPRHFSRVVLHEFVIMPNHLHGIICVSHNDALRGDGVSRNAVVGAGFTCVA